MEAKGNAHRCMRAPEFVEIKMQEKKIQNHKGKSRLAFFVLCLAALASCAAAVQVKAQTSGNSGSAAAGNVAPQVNAAQNVDRESDKPVNLFRALNLSPDQQAQIKAIRRQNREARIIAAERLQRAQRELDEAIYADNVNEAMVAERRSELAAAQSESVRIETQGQLNIRRVLTPEQLVTLRALRQQARTARQARRAAQQQMQQPRVENANNQIQRSPDRFENRRRDMPGNAPAGNTNARPPRVLRERRGRLPRRLLRP